jgi:hypothetical protein
VDLLGGDGAEVGAANKLREQATRVREVSADARSRAAKAATTARVRAADGLENAAEYLQELSGKRASAEGFQRRVAEGAQRFASGLDATARSLRDGDTDTIRGAVEHEFRANPARSLLATFALGFVIGRVLR